MSNRGKTILRGHALVGEGMGFKAHGEPDGEHAKCECGAMSPPLPSNRARQRWHRDVHKPAVRAAS